MSRNEREAAKETKRDQEKRLFKKQKHTLEQIGNEALKI